MWALEDPKSSLVLFPDSHLTKPQQPGEPYHVNHCSFQPPMLLQWDIWRREWPRVSIIHNYTSPPAHGCSGDDLGEWLSSWQGLSSALPRRVIPLLAWSPKNNATRVNIEYNNYDVGSVYLREVMVGDYRFFFIIISSSIFDLRTIKI